LGRDVQRRDNLDQPIRRGLVVYGHGFIEFDDIASRADNVVVEFLYAHERINGSHDIKA
jgi:hypothetical protein